MLDIYHKHHPKPKTITELQEIQPISGSDRQAVTDYTERLEAPV